MKYVLGAVVGALMMIPLWLAVRGGLYGSFVDNSLSGWGMWGTFAIYLWTRPGRKECATTVLSAVLARLAYDVTIGEQGYPGSLVIGMGAFLGPACLCVLAVRSLESPSERRAVCRRSLGVVALLSYIGVCFGFYIAFAKLALPRKLDYFLYAFDHSLGFDPSFLAGKLFNASSALLGFEGMVYESLGFWFSLIYAVHAAARTKYRIGIVKLLVANAFIGFSLYFLYPAMGPKYAFEMFPELPSAVEVVPAMLPGIPNAMPSLHFGGALLIFWLSKPWKWLYRITGVFAALTALATLGLGEHYLIDLVVAFPYALAILAFSSTLPERKPPLIAGAGALFAWLLLLRSGSFFPVVSWLLVLATVAGSVLLQRRFAARLWTAEAE